MRKYYVVRNKKGVPVIRQTFTVGGFVLYASLRVFGKQKILFSCKSKGMAKAYLELIKEVDKKSLTLARAFASAGFSADEANSAIVGKSWS